MGDIFRPDPPDAPKPPPIEDPLDYNEAEAIARTREELDRRRRARASLIIDTPSETGLSI